MKGLLLKCGILANGGIRITVGSSGNIYFPSTEFGGLFYDSGTSSLNRNSLSKVMGRRPSGTYPEYTENEAVELAARLCLSTNDASLNQRNANEALILKSFDTHALVSIETVKTEEEKAKESRELILYKYLTNTSKALYVSSGGMIGIRLPSSSPYHGYSTTGFVQMTYTGISGLCGGATISTSIPHREGLEEMLKEAVKEICRETEIKFSLEEVLDMTLSLSIRKIVANHGGGTFIFHDAKTSKSDGFFDKIDRRQLGARTISLLLSLCSEEFRSKFYISDNLREKNPKTGNYIDLFILTRTAFSETLSFLESIRPAPVTAKSMLDNKYIVTFKNKEDGSIVKIEA